MRLCVSVLLCTLCTVCMMGILCHPLPATRLSLLACSTIVWLCFDFCLKIYLYLAKRMFSTTFRACVLTPAATVDFLHTRSCHLLPQPPYPFFLERVKRFFSLLLPFAPLLANTFCLIPSVQLFMFIAFSHGRSPLPLHLRAVPSVLPFLFLPSLLAARRKQ